MEENTTDATPDEAGPEEVFAAEAVPAEPTDEPSESGQASDEAETSPEAMVEEAQVDPAEGSSLEPMLLEIKQAVGANAESGMSFAATLGNVERSVAAVTAQVDAITKALDDMSARQRAAETTPSSRDATHLWFLGISVTLILVSWSTLVFLRTGSLVVSLGVLVGAGLAGWVAVLFDRR